MTQTEFPKTKFSYQNPRVKTAEIESQLYPAKCETDYSPSPQSGHELSIPSEQKDWTKLSISNDQSLLNFSRVCSTSGGEFIPKYLVGKGATWYFVDLLVLESDIKPPLSLSYSISLSVKVVHIQ